MTRCFLGFELTEDSRRTLRPLLSSLHGKLAGEWDWPVRLVPPENWHATLLFFPDLSADERAEVWAEVEKAARKGVWRELAFEWRGLSLWPSPRRPNLVCLEAEPYPRALEWPLAAQADREPFSKGEVAHLRRYRPHITVMRFRREWKVPHGGERQALSAELPEIDGAAIRFDRVSLFLSTLAPGQPIYPREQTAPLAG